VDSSRALAVAAMTGGALLVVGNAFLLADPDARGLESGADYPTVAIVVAGAVLVCAGLVGVHLRQRTAYGRLGLTGFVLALVALLAAAAFLATSSEAPLLIGLLTGVIGFLVLTIAIVRAPVLPRWAGYLAYVGFVGLLVVSEADLGIATAGLVWIVIGYALWAGSERALTPAPSPA
jgi:hypothetical protein